MKIKMEKILGSRNSIKKIGDAQGLPGDIIIDVVKNIKAINAEIKIYDEARAKLFDEHCEKDEEGNFIVVDDKGSLKIKEGHYSIVLEEEKKLNDTIVDIAIKKIDYSKVVDAAKLTPFDVLTLEFMLKMK